MRSYGGKCLDVGTPPQVAHAPVFIATCNGGIGQRVGVEEINARHEVILHAGTKVLGMRGFSTVLRNNPRRTDSLVPLLAKNHTVASEYS